MTKFTETVIIALVLTVFYGSFISAEDWSYKKEKSWPGLCKTGHHQSPINLRKNYAQQKIYNDFLFRNYELKFPATIVNNGHSVAVKLKTGAIVPSILGGGLLHEYVFDHYHFHWNSEHTINNNRYPLELHIVHYANLFNSTTVAAQHEDGLAVLGILFEISEDDNLELEALFDKIDVIKENQGKVLDVSKEVSLQNLLPKDVGSFFRYEGSLTTPKCNEAVVWTVFYHLNYISKKQLEYFHTIKTDEGILSENYRSLQDIYDRVVIFRKSLQSGGEKQPFNISITFILFLFVYYTQKLLF